jgi:hypothetical protein
MEDLLLQSHDHVVAGRFPFFHSSPGRLWRSPVRANDQDGSPRLGRKPRAPPSGISGGDSVQSPTYTLGLPKGPHPSLPTESCHLISPPGLVRQSSTRPGQPSATVSPANYTVRRDQGSICCVHVRIPSVDSTCEYEYLPLPWNPKYTRQTHQRPFKKFRSSTTTSRPGLRLVTCRAGGRV